MVEFKVVLSDPKSGRAYNMTVSAGTAGVFVGKKIGSEVDGTAVGLPGYKFRITGGSDRDGTTARRDLPGIGRKKILLSGGTGFNPDHDGERRRKFVRGNEITVEFVQINTIVSASGEKPLEEYFPKEKIEKTETKKHEAKEKIEKPKPEMKEKIEKTETKEQIERPETKEKR